MSDGLLAGIDHAHTRVRVRDLPDGRPMSLHVVVAGPDDGTPVLMLHGFPDAWFGWHKQIRVLAEAGYRVIAPDQRGYPGSPGPEGFMAYRVEHLVEDMVDLLDALDASPAHVVGHDWGGGVAWALAGLHPEKVRTLTVANCPRASVLKRALLSNPAQMRKSWYMLAFQVPQLTRLWVTPARLAATLKLTSAPGTFGHDDLERYKQGWSAPDAIRGMTAWYQALPWSKAKPKKPTAPTLLLWGTADTSLGEELLGPSAEGLRDVRIERFHGASHWVQHERPEAVGAAIVGHVEAHGGADPYVYKLVDAGTWAAAPDPWPGSADDLRDGFVHLSARSQVAGTRDKYFGGVEGLVALAVDPGRLPAGALRWEESRGGQRFPHLYGPLAKDAVVQVLPGDSFGT